MKNLIIVTIMSFLFISCSNKKKENFNLQKIIDVDNNRNYEQYFESLSDIYLDFLKDENNTLNTKIVYDSILNEKKDLNKLIIDGELEMKNYIVDSFPTSDKEITIYKYRSYLLEIKSKTELIKEKIILVTNFNNEKKIIPYPTMNNSKFDSLLKAKTHPNIIKEIDQSFIFREYNNTDLIFQKTKKRFDEYFNLFKSNNLKFLDYIYPPIIEKINNNSRFNNNEKKKFLEDLKKSKNKQEFDFKKFIIDDFYKLDCSKDENVYIVEYLINIDENTYIPGKSIVFIKDDTIYFMEMDIQEIENYYNDIFSNELINCIKKNILK